MKMEFLDLPLDVVYLIRKRLSKYDRVFFDMVSRICYQLKNEGKKNRDLTFASSMSRYYYGLKNKIATVDKETFVYAIYHDNIELFNFVEQQIGRLSNEYDVRLLLELSAKHNARKIFFHLRTLVNYCDRMYRFHILSPVISNASFDILKELMKEDKFDHVFSNIELEHNDHHNPLAKAVESGNIDVFEIVKNISCRYSWFTRYKNSDYDILTTTAIRSKNMKMFDYLVERGYKHWKNEAIRNAACEGYLEGFIELHKRGYEINDNALESAESNRQYEIIEYVILNTEISNSGIMMEILRNLIYEEHYELANIAYEKGIDICYPDDIKYCYENGNIEFVRLVQKKDPELFQRIIFKIPGYLLEEN